MSISTESESRRAQRMRQAISETQHSLSNSGDDESARVVERLRRVKLREQQECLARELAGIYGICPSCGEALSNERLMALEKAGFVSGHCVRCADRKAHQPERQKWITVRSNRRPF